MQVLEVHSDKQGETHFRRSEVEMTLRDFAPPSQPISVSEGMPMSSGLILAAPPGWDPEYHPTPRKQFAILLSGRVSVAVTDGETIEAGPGSMVLLNDQGSKGHRTIVIGDEDAVFFLIAVAGES